MRRSPLTLLLLPLLAASAPAQPAAEPLDSTLKRAEAEQRAAEAETNRLEEAASKAKGEAEQLHAEQTAAAQSIEASEARITAAEARVRLASAYVAAHRHELAEQQQPVASLLAGLAVMARRPPLLVLADQGSTDALVEMRILLDSTLPVIRSRTRSISAQLTEGQRLEATAMAARDELVRSREDVVAKRQQFAALEQQAYQRALASGGQALSAGDVALAAGEDVERLRGEQSSAAGARAVAQQLAEADPAPPRPFAPGQSPLEPPFAYSLPAVAPVVEGLAEVNSSGVQSRGDTFATVRGSPVTAPADGVVRFSAAFRDYDGVLIIDHGGGWISLIVNVASPLKPGSRVRIGDPIGRALGPLEVELSHNGRRISPALIAG